MEHLLWGTPVWEIDTGFDTTFNASVLRELPPIGGGPDFNVWDNDGPHLATLRSFIEQQALKFAVPHYSGMDVGLRLQRGWVNLQRPGQMQTVHDHGGIAVAAVYYVWSEGAGDLMLVDPRGSTSFGNKREGENSNRKFHRISPKEGKLVLFPGYVLHYVEANTSGTDRISIASNFWITYGGK